ncbi:MAG: glutaredoxin family protein [Micrococcales bacterium]
MDQQIQLTLIGKPGCHLCDDAKLALDRVLFGFRAANPAVTVTVTELDILQDTALATKYAEEIPVLKINDKQHSFWSIDESRLRSALDTLVSATT